MGGEMSMERRSIDLAREEVLERLHSRGDFLKLLGAAGVGAAAGTSLLSGSAEGVVRTSLEPTDFHFTTRERFRPFNLLAKNFVRLDDSFNTNTEGNYTKLRPAPPNYDDGDVTISNGKLRFVEGSETSNEYYTILKSGTGQRAPYATVIIDVASLPNGRVYAGLYQNGNNYVHAYYDKDTHTVGLEAEVGGQYFLLGGAPVPVEEWALFDVPFRFAFVANENEVTALVGDPASEVGNYRPLIKRDVKYETGGLLDLRERDVLAAFNNGFGARSETGSTIALDRVRAGYFGEAGVRDPHVVQYADGTPYIKNNKLFFTLTNAGLGLFEKAHWTV